MTAIPYSQITGINVYGPGFPNSLSSLPYIEIQTQSYPPFHVQKIEQLWKAKNRLYFPKYEIWKYKKLSIELQCVV